MAGNAPLAGIIFPAAGIFLMACGSSALNQYQERKIDALMERTKNRPVPSGDMSPGQALLISLVLLLSGAFIILLKSNLAVLTAGFFAVFWYNVVYVYLKKRTAFAVIPGALIGAVPPVAGWLGGGGSLSDPRILMLAFFFFLWQVPHFWLIFLVTPGDYKKAGLPSITNIFNIVQLKRIIFVWIFAVGTSSLFFPAFEILHFSFYNIGFIVLALSLIWSTARILKLPGDAAVFKKVFKQINLFALAVMLIIILDNVFYRYEF